ncbi:DUF1573 domain-containing protein [Opitutus sp. GAS368]|uniref:DUF1573 domain-containing protein n=1 Tax=Opitutus sp. GAS368 TaxID=1882749 RepID=UPI00087D08E9|nr:DUF1573 domain-containing protein [Opitutus sp. GAS368]SDS52868.1 Protein of unknown function [Opitutus sp. GAS368]
MILRRPLLCCLFAAAVLPGAALEWKAQTLDFTTAPFQATQDAVFQFTNTGHKPVTILEVESNCDCLDAAADRQVYAPGASGVIKTNFHVGDRLGLYERRIKVVTDESPEPVRLLVRIEVPELVVLSPRSVAWKLHEPAVEKSVDLAVIPGLQINFTRVQPTSGDFAARLETVEAGRRYRVYLKPPETVQPANAAFRILGQAASGQEIVVSAYGNVR